MSGLQSGDLKVPKTIKLFINGKFARTESGRSYPVYNNKTEKIYAHLCQASRKDFRNAVEAAKKAQGPWSGRSAYNRGQILYRMAEMTEGHRSSLQEIMTETMAYSSEQAQTSIDKMIDAFVYYAGFTDKYQQVLGAVNPVASAHHNFTTQEAVGVVAHICRQELPVEDITLQIAATICSGNAVVTLLGPAHSALLAPLSEIFATSDLPAGVVNLLSGFENELYPFIGSHMEIQAVNYQGSEAEVLKELKVSAANSMKRVVSTPRQSLGIEAINDFVEHKTVWHPIGV